MSQNAAKQSSFYVAMRLMPKAKGDAMLRLYRFCRAVDDIADGPLPASDKEQQLQQWEMAIRSGEGALAEMQDTLALMKEYALPPDYFLEIIAGMRQDAAGEMVQPSLPDLQRYCYRAASCVGLLSLPIFGCKKAESRDFAIALGHALQLTNMLRDVLKDANMGRIYLPREWLEEAGCAEVTPVMTAGYINELKPVLRRMAALAMSFFAAADAQMHEPRALWPALLMRDAYRLLLQRMLKDDFSYLAPYALPAYAKPYLLWRYAVYRLASFGESGR